MTNRMLLSFDDPGVEELFCVDDAVTNQRSDEEIGSEDCPLDDGVVPHFNKYIFELCCIYITMKSLKNDTHDENVHWNDRDHL